MSCSEAPGQSVDKKNHGMNPEKPEAQTSYTKY